MTDHSDHIREAATFAENVRRELRAHPAEIVADLTDGLESDIAASLGDGAVLSTPGSYANDLLRGAGLEPLSKGEGTRNLLGKAESRVLPLWNKLCGFTVGLAPAWWVFRAWIVMQLLGAVVSDGNSSYGIVSEWGELPFVGLLLFIALLIFSVQWGRSMKPARRQTRIISHCVIAIASVFILVSETNTSNYPSTTWTPNTMSTCAIVDVPDVVGLTVADAEMKLSLLGIPFDFFDQDSMVDVASAPPQALVLQQDLEPGPTTFCGERGIQLVVDLANGPNEFPATSMPPEGATPDTKGGQTTTTIPAKSSTTTVPKATTTTSP
jgi:hypothetical protein